MITGSTPWSTTDPDTTTPNLEPWIDIIFKVLCAFRYHSQNSQMFPRSANISTPHTWQNLSFLSLDEFDEGGAERGGGGLLVVGVRGRRRGRDRRRESVEVLVDWVGRVIGCALIRLSRHFRDDMTWDETWLITQKRSQTVLVLIMFWMIRMKGWEKLRIIVPVYIIAIWPNRLRLAMWPMCEPVRPLTKSKLRLGLCRFGGAQVHIASIETSCEGNCWWLAVELL